MGDELSLSTSFTLILLCFFFIGEETLFCAYSSCIALLLREDDFGGLFFLVVLGRVLEDVSIFDKTIDDADHILDLDGDRGAFLLDRLEAEEFEHISDFGLFPEDDPVVPRKFTKLIIKEKVSQKVVG